MLLPAAFPPDCVTSENTASLCVQDKERQRHKLGAVSGCVAAAAYLGVSLEASLLLCVALAPPLRQLTCPRFWCTRGPCQSLRRDGLCTPSHSVLQILLGRPQPAAALQRAPEEHTTAAAVLVVLLLG